MSKTIIAILSMRDAETSHNYQPTEREWQNWIVGVYRSAVIKARGPVGYGPRVVASWAALRAGYRGWTDLFSFWAERAHRAGKVDKELVSSPTFLKVASTLSLDERMMTTCRRFRQEYEEANGYPFRWDD